MEAKRRQTKLQTMRMVFILRLRGSKLLYPDLIYRPYIQVEVCKMCLRQITIKEYYLATRKFKIVLSRGNLQLHLKKE